MSEICSHYWISIAVYVKKVLDSNMINVSLIFTWQLLAVLNTLHRSLYAFVILIKGVSIIVIRTGPQKMEKTWTKKLVHKISIFEKKKLLMCIHEFKLLYKNMLSFSFI